MEPISEVLKRKDLDKPASLTGLGEYILARYGYEPRIIRRSLDTVVYMKSASEANSLRMRYKEIQELCELSGKLYIRIE